MILVIAGLILPSVVVLTKASSGTSILKLDVCSKYGKSVNGSTSVPAIAGTAFEVCPYCKPVYLGLSMEVFSLYLLPSGLERPPRA